MKILTGVICLWGLVFLVVFWWVRLPAANAPVAIVVPHHDMVAETRAAYFEEVAREVQPKTIVLVSPDHFDRALTPIITSDRSWDTSVGHIESNLELLSNLPIPVQNDPFLREHGVTSIVKDIKNSFPQAKLVPIVINRKATYKEVTDLTNSLYTHCPDCLVIASVDFSHSSHSLLAELHDEIALRGLSALDSELLYKEAEVDSPESLVFLTRWARLHGAEKFNLFSHTNSGLLTDTVTGEMTTHIIGGYGKGKMATVEPVTTFMLAGDTMFARGVATQESPSEIFSLLGNRFFWGVDVALVGLEGVFSNSSSTVAGWGLEPPKLLFPLDYISLLKAQQIDVVTLANNHKLDDGLDSLNTSVALLNDLGIQGIGTESEIDEDDVYEFTSSGLPVVFINVDTHEPFTKLIEMIQVYDEKGYKVVVYAHWGEEYVEVHSPLQKKMAKDWIDAGADLIVGTHPHVVQDASIYKGVPIFYSLGNFVFDQVGKKTSEGAVLSGKFTDNNLELFIIPVNSYLKPRVFGSLKNNLLVDQWTESWSDYEVKEGVFKF